MIKVPWFRAEYANEALLLLQVLFSNVIQSGHNAQAHTNIFSNYMA